MPRAQDIMFYAAAGATAVAGIIHLILGVGNNNTNTQILFVVGGAAQLFWVLPMIRRWGIVWYLVGIGGTITFFAIWAITRIPDNPITGRGGSINQNGIIVEVAQLAFIALNIAILVMERRKKAKI